MTFDENIKKLKEKHARSKPETRERISRWEENMAHLKATKDWINHPNTRHLAQLCSEQIESINDTLANDEKIDQETRLALFKTKNAHITYLAVLTESPDSEIKSIENKVDYELQ